MKKLSVSQPFLSNDYSTYELQFKISRLIGLIILLWAFYFTFGGNHPLTDLYTLIRPYEYSWDYNLTSVCQPFQFKMVDNRQKLPLMTKSGKVVNVAVFSTHKLKGRVHPNINSAILVQHGNLRNGRDYFCTSMNSILSKAPHPENYLVLAPNFLSATDKCWNDETQSQSIINFLDPTTWCDFQIFSSEGWKDGLGSVNTNTTNDQFFSYDLYNLLIEFLSNRNMFPNLKNITLFGFSAGGQVILRYSILPKFNQTKRFSNSPPPEVRYVISDPSSYFYFDLYRPYQRNGLVDNLFPHSLIQYNNPHRKIPYSTSFSFGLPNITWNRWQVLYCLVTYYV